MKYNYSLKNGSVPDGTTNIFPQMEFMLVPKIIQQDCIRQQ